MTVNLVSERRREKSPVPLALGTSEFQWIVSRIILKEDIDTWVYEKKIKFIYIYILVFIKNVLSTVMGSTECYFTSI